MNWPTKTKNKFYQKINCWASSLFSKKPKIIIICGPTATGKTSLSIDLANQYRGEIISADSRQIYQGLDIGSAKITQKEMQGIPHHMIDVADPREIFTVQEFTDQVKTIISEIRSRGNIPIICGGTGMYIDALIYNQTFPNVPPNKKLRDHLEQRSTSELFEQLQSVDNNRASVIDRYNKVRIIRALEIVDSIGKVPKQQVSTPYRTLCIGLDMNNNILYQNVSQRIIERFEKEHMLDEARELYLQGVCYERMEALGLEYRYMARYLQKKISYQEMIEQLDTATRQFIKRQRTWFKRNKKIHWFDPQQDKKKIIELVEKFLKN